MERVQVGFLKVLLGVQVHTTTLHVLAEFCRYPLHVTWRSLAAKCLQQLDSLSPAPDKTLKQAFLADSKLPKKLSWQAKLTTQTQDFMVAAPSREIPDGLAFSLQSACSAHAAQLQLDPSSKTQIYKDIKVGYGCEPYIQNCSNRHLRRIVAQFRTGSHWLNIETGRHQGTTRGNRTCLLCNY